ncbi:MAG: isoleucyl-tRNA synthetase [Kiritimatiellia bacterium]|jgi:isoleucyl-tRNA synthetase
MFEAVSNKANFAEREEQILQFWDTERIFARSMEQRKDAEEYVFYDGPPFATGLPHYGHLLAGTIKDIIPRYQTMRGHYVERRFGWDTHGLPIEALAQKALGLSGTAAILDVGVDVFNEKCRSMVLQYVEEWRTTVNRMGRWVDFDNDYKTMDTDFMESVWWVFKQLWDKGRIYKDYRIMPYSWKLTTPLSNFEANSNYKDVQDPAITVRMRLTGAAADAFELPAYALAWTTTPWTLPSNLALCAGPDIDYVALKDKAEQVIYLLAEARVSAYYKDEADCEIVQRFKGEDLAGWTYEPLFPYFADQPSAFVMLNDRFVTTEDGTGVVHMAPAYGEDDYRVCKEVGIELVDPLDAEANFTERVPDWAGRNCKEADSDIIRALKDQGKLVHRSTIKHSYPFCERTETPLIYRAIDAWYVKVDDLNEKLMANNDTILWQPEFVGQNRFGTWLRDARDWNISRNRFWGSCLPIWISEDGEDMICMGSIAELEQYAGVRVDDLHKHVVDEIVFEKDGKTYRRTPEVLDCWFESGAMPYAQRHYPFENKEGFDDVFPAHFIAEGLDQTRGWFYTLLVLSTILFDKPAFKNVVVNGMILAADGSKMSKSKQNYPPPGEVIDQYGADALRLYLMDSPLVRAEPLRFIKDDEDRIAQEAASGKSLGRGGKTVQQTVRDLLLPWWNAYSFFVQYANIDGWDPEDELVESPNLMDRWVLSSLNRLNEEVVAAMDVYDLQNAVRPFVTFLQELCNWYIRLSRRRFWKSEDDDDKRHAYATLYEVLNRMARIGAPFVPFITETMYQNLKRAGDPDSVHLVDYPKPDASLRDHELETQMALIETVVVMGRSIRSEYDLKVRQPLRGIHVVTGDMDLQKNIDELKHLIQDELNVKEVWFGEDEAELVTLQAKPNFKTLGPRLGKHVKAAGRIIGGLTDEQIASVLCGEALSLDVEGNTIELSKDDLVVERQPREGLAVASEGQIVVALETELNEDLVREGLARELVNRIQNQRKQTGLEVTDRIHLRMAADAPVVEAMNAFLNYVQSETLITQFDLLETLDDGVEWDVNGYRCVIYMELASA